MQELGDVLDRLAHRQMLVRPEELAEAGLNEGFPQTIGVQRKTGRDTVAPAEVFRQALGAETIAFDGDGFAILHDGSGDYVDAHGWLGTFEALAAYLRRTRHARWGDLMRELIASTIEIDEDRREFALRAATMEQFPLEDLLTMFPAPDTLEIQGFIRAVTGSVVHTNMKTLVEMALSPCLATSWNHREGLTFSGLKVAYQFHIHDRLPVPVLAGLAHKEIYRPL